MANYISLEQALDKIANTSLALPIEKISIDKCLNRVTALDIFAKINNPSFNNSAVDGIGITKETLSILQKNPNYKLNIKRVILAGDSIKDHIDLDNDECLHIMTGAIVPKNICTVVMIEHTTKLDHNTISVNTIPKINSNIRPLGEDYKINDFLVSAGKLLNINDISLLASSGIDFITVYKKLKVAICTTGKETRSLKEELEVGQIYNSNILLLKSFFESKNCDITLIKNIPDDIQSLKTYVNEAIQQNVDIIVSSGAVSMGKEDIVKTYLLQNSDILYNGISIRPGKPNMLGIINNKTLYFGLPGNPVSCAVGLYILVQHYLNCVYQIKSNKITKALLNQDIKKHDSFTIFIRGYVYTNENAQQCVDVIHQQGSHMLKGLQMANCLICTPKGTSLVSKGSLVDLYLI